MKNLYAMFTTDELETLTMEELYGLADINEIPVEDGETREELIERLTAWASDSRDLVEFGQSELVAKKIEE